MEPERWRRLEEIFNSVVELDPSARDTRLLELCPSDPTLRAEASELCAEWDEAVDSRDALEEIVQRAATSACGEILKRRAERRAEAQDS